MIRDKFQPHVFHSSYLSTILLFKPDHIAYKNEKIVRHIVPV